MSLNSPVIGISGSKCSSASVMAMATQIRAMGGIPLVLSNHEGRLKRQGCNTFIPGENLDVESLRHAVSEDLKKIDSLIVMGNDGDIDPARYGQEKHATTQIETDKGREAYEYAILEQAMTQKMPILGVCGGMQRLNVMQGGTLHQDLPSLQVGHNHSQSDTAEPFFTPVQPVYITESSTLGHITGQDNMLFTPAHGTFKVEENSMHHQAVDKVGAGFRVAARSDDLLQHDGDSELKGTIEAIEADPKGNLKDQTIIGVQWHPEFGASPLGPKIAGFMVEKAKAFAKTHERQHPLHEAVDESIFSNQNAAVDKLAEWQKKPDASRPVNYSQLVGTLQQRTSGFAAR